jgi:NADPH-dependent F420 reductase
MKVAIIGAGDVGGSLARVVSNAGQTAVISAENEDQAKAIANETGGSLAASNAEAAREADIIMLAIPYEAMDTVLDEIAAHTAGKIVVDATNPVKPDGSGLATGAESGAEHVQARLVSSSVVKAFNTVFAGNQANPVVDGVALDGYVAGDDPAARATIMDLLRTTGYRPLDVGPLSFARALEHMGFLNISLNARYGWAWKSGWKLVGPTG